MITGDNPLTAVHVAREVEIVDREALILDLAETLSTTQVRTHPWIFSMYADLPQTSSGARWTNAK